MSIYNGYGKTKIEIYDYLNGDGYSFINTNYLLKSSDLIKFKVQIISGFTQYRYVFGAMTTSQSEAIDIRNDTSVSKLKCFVNGNPLRDANTNTAINLSEVVYGIFEITISSSNISCNNAEFSHNTSLPNTKYPLYIFRKNRDNDNTINPVCNFAYFEITNNLLLRPCKLKGTLPASYTWDNQVHYANECGMWDSVNKKFYGNANSEGRFTVTGNKINEFEIVENKVKYIALANSNNTVVYPKKVYFANSNNTLKLVYERPTLELYSCCN